MRSIARTLCHKIFLLFFFCVFNRSLLVQAQTSTAQPSQPEDTRKLIEMRPGDTHLESALPSKSKFARWMDFDRLILATRYQYVKDRAGEPVANHQQYQFIAKAKFKFDADGKYYVGTNLMTGRDFFTTWNNVGTGDDRSHTNLYLKQLFFHAKLLRGVEIDYGGLEFLHGENTDVITYAYEGFLTGQRVRIARPDQLFFDEISYTAGYTDERETPNVFKRLKHLKDLNLHRLIFTKRIGERIRTSGEYSSLAGSHDLRQAIHVELPEAKVIDSLVFENYEHLGQDKGYGFNIFVEKELHERFRVGGGFARIDRNGLNSDHFSKGKRFYYEGLINLSPEFSIQTTINRAIGKLPHEGERFLLHIALNYNLLNTLKRNGF